MWNDDKSWNVMGCHVAGCAVMASDAARCRVIASYEMSCGVMLSDMTRCRVMVSTGE